ncbi:MAG: glycogen synthase [Bacillota bacterium]|mgnify:CR=1 FL=1|jgi:starch synthase|nr:glycogen synthase [Bacillota bacterium]
MKILMVTSESNPFAKTGGLADVVYALSKEQAVLGHEVSIVLPKYGSLMQTENLQMRFIASVPVSLGWREQVAKIFKTVLDGITFYFVDNEYYFAREGLYGYYDDMERFAFFTLAVRNMLEVIKLKPDIIHVHDWQPGMLPVLIKEQNKDQPFYKKMKFVLTIHNPAFQGMFDPNLIVDFYGLPIRLYDNGLLRFNDRASSLKAAIMTVDKITTVSPTHASELLTPEGSKGLDPIINLRRDDFVGILNGIDYQEFNPLKDPNLPLNFSNRSLNRKEQLKKLLFEELNIDYHGQALYGMVSRLTWQKGINLVLEAAELVLQKGASVVIVGSGEYGYEQEFERLRARYPNTMAIYIGYNNQLAHRVYAASDFFFMPSLFEPCGIGQMIAMRYATLPIVRRTGGLNDTVIGYDGQNEDEATGFVFDEYNRYWMNLTTLFALEIYQDKELLKKLRLNTMRVDNRWEKSAKEYIALYEEVVK